jgi:hypothetical protein
MLVFPIRIGKVLGLFYFFGEIFRYCRPGVFYGKEDE